MPAPRVKLLGSAGSFAGISILLGSPLAGAFLLMEASALGGPQLGVMLVPGLPLVAGIAMGIGAMAVVMLTLPLTAVLLATLLLGSDGLAVMPLVIVTVIVVYVAAARIAPRPGAQPTGGGQSDSGAHPDRASQA